MSRWSRVARGSAAATVSVFVAAFSHSVAGGSLPGVTGIALCLALSVLVCVALTGRRLPLARLAVSVAISQAMYHWLFGALGSGTMVASGGRTPGHLHDAALAIPATTPHAHAGGDMLLAHIAAAIVTVLVLAYGERSIAATARYAHALVVALLPAIPDAPAVPTPARLVPARLRVADPLPRRVDHSGLRHRGPPAASVV
jgi:hypothetical protein